MKFKLFISAFLIAAFAALGLSQGALADTVTTDDLECTPIDSNTAHEILACTDKMTVEVRKFKGIHVTVEPVPEDTTLPNAPGVKFIGPATIIKVTDAKGQPVKSVFMQICFNDLTKANIFRWWTPADWKTQFGANLGGRWVYTPTDHNVDGMSCTINWLPGSFTIN
jgi:hypothetical protein